MSVINDPKLNRPIYFIDKDFGEAAVRLADPLWDLPDITNKQKAFLCIASDITSSCLGLPLILHMKMAFKCGAMRREIKEVILQTAPHAGFTKALRAMIRLKLTSFWRAFKERKIPEKPPTSKLPDLIALLPQGINEDYLTHFKNTLLPIWKRNQLELEDRVLIALACDVINQTLDSSFLFHLNVAKAIGVTKEKCQQAVLFVSEYSFEKSWNAIEKLDKFFGK